MQSKTVAFLSDPDNINSQSSRCCFLFKFPTSAHRKTCYRNANLLVENIPSSGELGSFCITCPLFSREGFFCKCRSTHSTCWLMANSSFLYKLEGQKRLGVSSKSSLAWTKVIIERDKQLGQIASAFQIRSNCPTPGLWARKLWRVQKWARLHWQDYEFPIPIALAWVRQHECATPWVLPGEVTAAGQVCWPRAGIRGWFWAGSSLIHIPLPHRRK